jgi:glycosyltransferase involved in cell wall biosynthesis
MPTQRKLRIVFAGVVRDCERYLPSVLRGIDALSAAFPESAFIFVENDSQDSTKAILNEWGARKNNFRLVNLDGLAALPRRGLRLEIARATYIELIKADYLLSTYDFLVVLDMDDVNVMGVDLGKFLEALEFMQDQEDHAAVFANQEGTYYDMWTLRHETLCPGDIWEEVLDWAHEKKVSDEEAYRSTFARRIFSLPTSNTYLEVKSAFGGFAIYKLSYVLRNQNPYLGSKVKILRDEKDQLTLCRWEICEHVHFNFGIKNLGGRLFIKQDLINAFIPGSEFPPSAYRNFIF